MECPKCQADTKDEAKFCGKCGAKLSLVCPQCGSENPRENNFCEECGHNISVPAEPPARDLSFEEKIAKIQRYLPKGLTEKILSQRYRIEGERKQVTVMFADMEGFTALSEKVGPEEAYAIMDQVYEILIHKVHDYEGTVNEMTGDGIMALFGAPIALEDAPQRAIRSAYAIHREMVQFSDQIEREKGLQSIRMRIGIHTGRVVVGTLGNDLRVEFKAVGDTVNLASRVESLADPGSTYVTEDTFKLTEGLFRFEGLGERQVKGKEEPVGVYRVIAPSTRRTRFDVSAERGLTPFVGRERELELLLDGFERAKSGRGQAFSIMAEAGVGKSRLLYEFRKAIANEDVTFIEGRCLSYSRNVAYHPVIDTLKSSFNIRESDGDSEIKEKVKRGLKTLGVDEASTLPCLLELLSVKESGIDGLSLSPQARKDRTIEALNRNVLKGSEIRPVVMAVEDLQWIDKTSEDRFKSLLDSISGSRVFLVFTYRPEFVHTWGGRSYHSQVNLNRLSNRESLAMVAHLLGTEDIDRALEELILEKTEGVPFFIEEFIRSLKDLKIIERKNNRYQLARDIQDLPIPATIQDVIMARVDSLPEGAKEVLQTGSVIGREFSYELIKQVTSISQEELLTHLSVLKDSELLYERGIYPESTYIFKHALTQEVVYDSILTSRRKKLHGEIGNVIEEFFGDNISDHYEVLAEHYITSENYIKGAEYCRLAQRKAEKAASFPDAITYAKKKIDCLEKLPQTDDVLKKIIDARTILGLYMFQLFYFVEAKEAVDPIIELAIKSDYQKRIAQIYAIKGAYECWVREDLSRSIRYLQDALRISEEVADIVSLFFANAWAGWTLSYNCRFERAIYHVNKALDINVSVNNLWGISSMKTLLSAIFSYQGKVNLAFQASNEALEIAEESGDIYSKSGSYAKQGGSLFLKGTFGEAEAYLLKAVELSERINFFACSAGAHFELGEVYFNTREYQKSKDHYEKAIWFLEQNGILPSWVGLIKICIAKVEVMKNNKDINFQSLYSCEVQNRINLYDGWIRRYIGEILLNNDDQHMSEAEHWIKKAIEADERNGMGWHLAQDYALYAELLRRKGDRLKAKENLSQTIKLFEECGADGWLEKAQRELEIVL
ncbi:MAG: adenylate/guanylate cyclase domain-containing protein [Candidatus Hodarchaeota archaeon]